MVENSKVKCQLSRRGRSESSAIPKGEPCCYGRSLVEDSIAQNFITRWKNSGAAKRANYQLFLSEIRDLLGVARGPLR